MILILVGEDAHYCDEHDDNYRGSAYHCDGHAHNVIGALRCKLCCSGN